MRIIGLDIGTTTICGIVADTDSHKLLESVTEPNDSFIKGREFEKIQDADKILKKVFALCERLSSGYAPIDAIGITGQMHGIVYLDENADAVSPLYTWQDGSGNEASGGESYASRLQRLTGYKCASGFGAVTHYYHVQNALAPQTAVAFCTIHDWAAMKLSGRKKPLCHVSDAASLGLFDIENNCFDLAAIEKAGLKNAMFPEVCNSFELLGHYKGIPVAAAIGDNQASFIGSVADMEHTALVNLGTGGQISMATKRSDAPSGTELRPLCGDERLLVGCSLCGGRAFAMLEELFRGIAECATGEKIATAYKAMDALLAKSSEPENPLTVSTKFGGTRDNPEERGSISNIGVDNLTPQALMYGFLDGMTNELFEMYAAAGEKRTKLVGSGNGLRKNYPLQARFSKAFEANMKIPLNREEAAFGAVIFAAVAAGICTSLSDAQRMIEYIN